jgi:hypothetical protein
VHVPSASSATAAALATLAAYTGGTRFTADTEHASAAETSGQEPSVFALFGYVDMRMLT